MRDFNLGLLSSINYFQHVGQECIWLWEISDKNLYKIFPWYIKFLPWIETQPYIFTVTIAGGVMAVTTSINVSQHIFHHHFLFIGETGRNIESRPGEPVESEKIFQLIYDVQLSPWRACFLFSIPTATIILRASDLSTVYLNTVWELVVRMDGQNISKTTKILFVSNTDTQ